MPSTTDRLLTDIGARATPAANSYAIQHLHFAIPGVNFVLIPGKMGQNFWLDQFLFSNRGKKDQSINVVASASQTPSPLPGHDKDLFNTVIPPNQTSFVTHLNIPLPAGFSVQVSSEVDGNVEVTAIGTYRKA